MGLGLYICRCIAHAHDGTIAVESTEAHHDVHGAHTSPGLSPRLVLPAVGFLLREAWPALSRPTARRAKCNQPRVSSKTRRIARQTIGAQILCGLLHAVRPPFKCTPVCTKKRDTACRDLIKLFGNARSVQGADAASSYRDHGQAPDRDGGICGFFMERHQPP